MLRPGLQLGLDDARRLAARRRCHVVGILGAPDAGKTASLVSLYLLLAGSKMARWQIANSMSLIAFEMLARGARRWDIGGEMPTQMTSHTELADPRTPGFLHLRVRDTVEHSLTDLLFPDLPGEWTDALIDHNAHDRLAFMGDADALWLMVDGVALSDPDSRKGPIGRLKHLVGRAAKIVRPSIPLIIVVTRKDKYGQLPEGVLSGVTQEAEQAGFAAVSVVEIASFSDNPATDPGAGLEELLQIAVASPPLVNVPPPLRPAPQSGRHMLRYRAQ